MVTSGNVAFGCDVHTHTIFSRHAYSTIGECVAVARERGLELLGSCDHYSCMISPTLHVRDYQHFINFSVWPRIWDGVWVMRGAEADIVDLDGHLFGWDLMCQKGITGAKLTQPITLKDMVWRSIDYAVASIHDATFARGASLAQTTNMYVRALADPKVLILGHLGRSGVPADLDTVLLAAKERNKLIEINEHSFQEHYGERIGLACRRIAERCAELGVMIATSTDAHIAHEVGRFDAVSALLEEIHFPQELVATRDAKTFLGVLEEAVGACA